MYQLQALAIHSKEIDIVFSIMTNQKNKLRREFDDN